MFPWCAEWEAELNGLFRAYVERKLANQALDYDDLLLYWHAMMQDEALAAEIGARSTTSWSTSTRTPTCCRPRSCKRLKPSGEGVTVVGDDAQAIYSFRAATVENILGFPEAVRNHGCHPGGELPLDAAGAGRRECADRQEPLLEEEARREAALRHGRRRRGAGAVRGEAGARGARARRAAAGARRCCSAPRTTPTCSSSSWCGAISRT